MGQKKKNSTLKSTALQFTHNHSGQCTHPMRRPVGLPGSALTEHFIRNTYLFMRLSNQTIALQQGNAYNHAGMGQELHLMFTSTNKLGKKMRWNDCCCQTGWFEYLRNSWSPGIFTHNSLWRMIWKTNKKKIQRAAVLQVEMGPEGERPDWSKLTGSNANNQALQQWYAEEHLWTHNVSNPSG